MEQMEDKDFTSLIKSTPDNKFFYTQESTMMAKRFEFSYRKAFKE
jgi:hypothetical protein